MAAPAAAQTRTAVTLAPYIWAPTVTGTASLGPLSLPIRATPGQLASGVRAGILGHATIERGDLFAAAEVIAVDFHRRGFAPVLGQDVKVRAASMEVEVGRSFQLAPALRLGPFAGARYNNLRVNVGTAPANIAVAGDWIEPSLGTTITVTAGRRWTANAKLVRGFGGDRHSVDVRGDIDFGFARRVSAFAGYRHTGQVYRGDDFAVDLSGDGPLIGLRGRF